MSAFAIFISILRFLSPRQLSCYKPKRFTHYRNEIQRSYYSKHRNVVAAMCVYVFDDSTTCIVQLLLASLASNAGMTLLAMPEWHCSIHCCACSCICCGNSSLHAACSCICCGNSSVHAACSCSSWSSLYYFYTFLQHAATGALGNSAGTRTYPVNV